MSMHVTLMLVTLQTLFCVQDGFMLPRQSSLVYRGVQLATAQLSTPPSVVQVYKERLSTNGPDYQMLDYQPVPGYDLTLSVGESLYGLGLFIQVAGAKTDIAETRRVDVPQGTLMCDYRGSFDLKYKDMATDRVVQYKFSTIETHVYLEDQGAVVPLFDALRLADDVKNGVRGTLQNRLRGHVVSLNDGQVEISVEPGYDRTCFATSRLDTSTDSFGQYCNDLAFVLEDTTTKEEYMSNTDKNVLMLLWKMKFEEKSGCLEPVAPCLCTKRDLAFQNVRPMELGISYSWNYWLNHLG